MSRSNYSDDCDGWALIRWRGAVQSAIRGKRGQAFLKELLAALEAMPKKELIADVLVQHDEYCALGALGHARGIVMTDLDDYDPHDIAEAFQVAPALVQEIMFENDEDWLCRHATPDNRWHHMHEWVQQQIKREPRVL
jgi:hypothetical protein